MPTILAVAVVAGGSLLSTASPQERAASLEQLTACRSISEGSLRLTCYDAAVSALDAAERQGEVIVMDRAQVGEARRQLFGFEMPALPRLLGSGGDADIDAIETTLASATQAGDGRWVFRLADGGVWGQIDAGRVQFRNRADQTVRVRRASLGSYLLTVGDSRAVRVRRQ